ncbi:hypothetical protein [Paenimyroides aestuarii]|uniref:Uncharacterized protein n=1 Tax=Paenimyroides aestuarii TaxID=2968490 RepID=A0ABY5NRN7_9FLAO|nr:hypothetical protein [Paenimyroides aestuarii]UUV21245.1 hypothetical protein NPX36_13095 [Paenimyroides aestuarii]
MNKEEKQKNSYLNQLKAEFPEFDTEDKKIFELTETDFPFSWKDPLKAADNVLKMLARHMSLNHKRIELMFYEQYPEDDVENPSSIFLRFKNEKKSTLTDYQSPVKRYSLNFNASVFEYADWVIAAIAHELCYLKLLENGNFDLTDEKLIEVATIYFGFGKIQLVSYENYKKK